MANFRLFIFLNSFDLSCHLLGYSTLEKVMIMEGNAMKGALGHGSLKHGRCESVGLVIDILRWDIKSC